MENLEKTLALIMGINFVVAVIGFLHLGMASIWLRVMRLRKALDVLALLYLISFFIMCLLGSELALNPIGSPDLCLLMIVLTIFIFFIWPKIAEERSYLLPKTEKKSLKIDRSKKLENYRLFRAIFCRIKTISRKLKIILSDTQRRKCAELALWITVVLLVVLAFRLTCIIDNFNFDVFNSWPRLPIIYGFGIFLLLWLIALFIVLFVIIVGTFFNFLFQVCLMEMRLIFKSVFVKIQH